MSEESKRRSNLKISFPVVLTAVFFLHVCLIAVKALPTFNISDFSRREAIKLTIRPLKTPKVLNANTNIPIRNVKTISSAPKKGEVSFKDLAVPKPVAAQAPVVKSERPGTRPDVGAIKAVHQISMHDNSFKQFAKSYPSGIADVTNVNAGAFKISDATIGIENPDGVEPDELNQNELVYYGFQKRMLVGYINTIVKEIEKFGAKHRHYQLDPNTKLVMTARLTYDSEGNVKQIKMVRWTHMGEIQELFETSMRNLNRLNNPPKMLWTKSGEFNVFYNFTISNG